ncbi:hypothetical protein [Hydrogenophaga aquatica]
MGILDLFFHVINFLLPAVALAGLLTPGVVGWRGLRLTGPAARRFLHVWLVLGGVGMGVLMIGLAWYGRDGRMATYAALVLVMGSTAWWLRRH